MPSKTALFGWAVAVGVYQTCETYLTWSELVYEIMWYSEFLGLPYELPAKTVYPVVSSFDFDQPAKLTPVLDDKRHCHLTVQCESGSTSDH